MTAGITVSVFAAPSVTGSPEAGWLAPASVPFEEADVGALEAADLYELDDLLQRPVRLVDTDVQRLAVIPWVTTPQLEALRAALPLASVEAWAALPHWSAPAVTAVLPFVEAPRPAASATKRPTAWHSQAAVRQRPGRRRLQASMHTPHVGYAVQVQDPAQPRVAGFLRLQARGARVLIGDMRRHVGMGLLWSGRALSTHALDVGMPRSTWRGSASLWRDRVLRGVGVEARWDAGSVLALQGTTGSTRLRGGSATWRGPRRLQVALTAMTAGSRLWAGGTVSQQERQASWFASWWRQATGWVGALHATRRRPGWRLDLQFLVAPRGVDAPSAGAPREVRRTTWHRGRLRVSGRTGSLRWRFGALRGVRHTVQSQQRWDMATHLRWQRPAWHAELRTRHVRHIEETTPVEGGGRLATLREQRLSLRFVLPLPRGWTSLERRARTRWTTESTRLHGHAWRLALQVHDRRFAWQSTLAFHEADPGAGVVFAEPGVSTTPVLVTGSGHGMRLASRLRWHARGWTTSLRSTWAWRTPGQSSLQWEWALRWRSSGTNAF